MRYVSFLLALVLAALSLMHRDEPNGTLWMSVYGAGALLALTACKPSLNRWTVRILATAATGTMFLYFAGFFFRAPYLAENWYAADGHSGTLALLVAGFCMMPIVSAYSCRMKALPETA